MTGVRWLGVALAMVLAAVLISCTDPVSAWLDKGSKACLGIEAVAGEKLFNDGSPSFGNRILAKQGDAIRALSDWQLSAPPAGLPPSIAAQVKSIHPTDWTDQEYLDCQRVLDGATSALRAAQSS